MSITRHLNNQLIGARKRSTAEQAAPQRKQSAVPSDRAALKPGVGGNRRCIW